jgi:hypothetical protein
VAIVGQESLQCDEHANPRTPAPAFPQDVYLVGSTPEEYAPQLDKLMDQLAIDRPVRLKDTTGGRVWGVELRSVVHDGKTLVSLVNLNRHPVAVRLVHPGATHATELIEARPVALDCPLGLEPRKPCLLELQ